MDVTSVPVSSRVLNSDLLTESLGWHNRYLRTGNMRRREEN
jgi:hypothetical protein